MLCTGSAGGGKSRLVAEKLHGYLKKYPRATGLAMRKAREYAGKSIVPFLQHTVIGKDPQVHLIKSEMTFEYSNGSLLYIGGMKDDSQRESIRSIGGDGSLDIVWLEEANAFTEDDINEVLARMRGKAADWRQIMLSTNPDTPTHWIKQHFIDGGQASVYYSGALDNPYNPPDYIETLQQLTGILYDRLVLGLWKQAEGAVYDFDSRVHLIQPFDIPADWRRFRVVDFGYTNPFVCQWWAVDGEGRMYMYREIYMSQRIVEDHAQQILVESTGEAIETTVCDHDAEDRATLERHRIRTIPARKDVSVGIQAVQQRLKVQPDGKPRLMVFQGALIEEDERIVQAKKPRSTTEEFTGYSWPKSADGKAIKEAPVKVNDHGMDAVRYAVMYVDQHKRREARNIEW